MYRRPMPWGWWWQNGAYFRFIVRELTSVFVGFFAVLSILQVRALGQGAEGYERFVERLGTPVFIVLNSVALVAVLYHAITWFNLTPTVTVVRLRDKRVPDWVVAGAHYVGCAVLSGVVVWILLSH